MIRVVVDANVFVSAIIKPDSVPGTIINLIGQGLVRLVISQEIIAEIRQVLLYPKIKQLHRLTPKLIDQALAEISEAAMVTSGAIQINGVKDDPKDNKYLECAIEGQVDFIISGDHHLIDLKEFEGIKIVEPATFLKLMAGQQGAGHARGE
jgi:putative PIN family toxin of toxin-antitoxin system